MQILLEILLYLQLIFGPGTYQESEIESLETINQPQISLIQSDVLQLDAIHQQYGVQASQIIVVDDKEDP